MKEVSKERENYGNVFEIKIMPNYTVKDNSPGSV